MGVTFGKQLNDDGTEVVLMDEGEATKRLNALFDGLAEAKEETDEAVPPKRGRKPRKDDESHPTRKRRGRPPKNEGPSPDLAEVRKAAGEAGLR